jgi:hypothetical protein
MTATCPAGHPSSTEDYCDVCGAAIAAAPAAVTEPEPAAAPTAAAAANACANCGAARDAGDAFCEVCGLDFATGELPQPPPPPEELEPGEEAAPAPYTPPAGEEAAPDSVPAAAPVDDPDGEWVAVVEADRDFFNHNEAEGSSGAVAFPEDMDRQEVVLVQDRMEIGRLSETSETAPDVALEDPGVSRRHARLERQTDRTWAVIDEGSTNGTRVRGSDPIEPEKPATLNDGDHIHIGAYTRITLQRRGPAPA